MRALLSVYDKEGLADLASGLVELGWELLASGNTAASLADAGISHLAVSEVTGSPEILGGRVKTLHPAIHGGILADRSVAGHLADLEAEDIEPIDLVVCNLYPFSSNPSVELIDVGGPTMVRAAAKNFAHVGVVVSPADYGPVLDELRREGRLSQETRRRLARAAFAHSAAYDAAIVAWMDAGEELPETLHLSLERADVLRYGENPHQHGARYRIGGRATWWDAVTQHAGSALSYLNLFDADAAWRLVHELAADSGLAAAAIIKHANPCGAAVAEDLAQAYRLALDCDPTSAFGGVVALAGPIDAPLAEVIAAGPQADVILAPEIDTNGRDRLVARRKATRLLSAPAPEPAGPQVRSIGNSVLVQEADVLVAAPADWRVVTSVQPTEEQWRDLVLAWRICARTSSNAIVVVSAGQAVGIGAGQQSRVGAAQIALSKAGARAEGGAAASDAFFPFKDGLEVLAEAGVAAVVHPGGSVGDAAVIEAAEASGIALVATGERHFRH
ncbi:MAG TPA: bifunctional phosphoribosylaminoimidazolecarboxamide formyltransferase/IMP cyclohydrolase [Acidimicrobiales bacterium]|nr:bifunctional phosphoribosylaminoimidazolecarboxamide formyltransferase/IMP cyclohydrolase [Acidimicrobiales bacterium]